MKRSSAPTRGTCLLICCSLAGLLCACSKPAELPVGPAPLFQPTASVQEIMQSIIDPNIDAVWNSVATISTAAGTEERAPKTDQEWNEVRQHALTVLEASNLLLIEGRQIAASGASTSSHAVELKPADIAAGIQHKRADFVRHAHALHDAVSEAVSAIDQKDSQKLVQAGGRIDQVCESCHSQFWYPNDKPPR